MSAPAPARARSGERVSRRRPARPSLLGMPSRDALVDLAFALVLVTIALVGFRTGFIGVEWVVAATVGVVLGTLVAHVATVRSWPLLLTALVLVAAHVVLGGPVAVRGELILSLIHI